MNGFPRILLATLFLASAVKVSPAQNANYPANSDATPAISGYEQELSKELVRELKEFSPKTDNAGNVWVEFGSGEPHRLIATGMAGQKFVKELQAVAEKEHVKTVSVAAAAPRIASYTEGAELPRRFVDLGVPTLWPVTPAEYASWADADQVQKLLEAYLEIQQPTGGIGGGSYGGMTKNVLEALVEAYGASRHEEAVRKVVLNRLDSRLRSKVALDAGGNLVLHLGDGKKDAKTPRIAIVAHMDEIGYEVKRIEDDGRVQVDALGGGYMQYFLGHVVLVHKKNGSKIGGVLELPSGWDKAGFEWPMSSRSMDEPARVYVGTQSKKETEQLGIVAGDFVTVPK